MQRASILASVMGLTLVAPAMAQNATGGGASGGGGGGAIVESPQAGQTKMPAGTSSNTPGMGMATLSARPRQSVKPATYPTQHPAPTTGMVEPPPSGIRPVAAATGELK